MLIETFVDQVWEEYIESLQRSKQDKQALKDHRSWTTQHHIEMLSEIGRINPTVRNLLNKLRKKRNDVVHNRESVTDDESYSCLRVAIVIIVNRMNDPKNPFLNIDENNKLVDLWNCRE